MNILRFFESFRTCETERAPNARQNNGFFLQIRQIFIDEALSSGEVIFFLLIFKGLSQEYQRFMAMVRIKKSPCKRDFHNLIIDVYSDTTSNSTSMLWPLPNSILAL